MSALAARAALLRPKLIAASGLAGFGDLGRRVGDLEESVREHRILDPQLDQQIADARAVCDRLLEKRREMGHGIGPNDG
ncbi:MAG TPA: hypothetical protein PKA04_02775 [Marmoricola sp.]|nr:hypothetical protein [Marmoricola sp.]